MVPLAIQLAKNIENFNYWRFSVVLNEISNTIGKLRAYIYMSISAVVSAANGRVLSGEA